MLNHGICRYLIPRFRKIITWGFMVGSGTVIFKWHNFDKQKWDPKVLRWGIKELVHPVRCRLVIDVAGKKRNAIFLPGRLNSTAVQGIQTHRTQCPIRPNFIRECQVLQKSEKHVASQQFRKWDFIRGSPLLENTSRKHSWAGIQQLVYDLI